MTPRVTPQSTLVATLGNPACTSDAALLAADAAEETATRISEQHLPFASKWLLRNYAATAAEWRRAADTLRSVAPLLAKPRGDLVSATRMGMAAAQLLRLSPGAIADRATWLRLTDLAALLQSKATAPEDAQ